MTERKFKVGDRVVVYPDGSATRGEVVGHDSVGDIHVLHDHNKCLTMHYAMYAVLEAIYDSPLYKALS